jgi:spore coat protein U-like protein
MLCNSYQIALSPGRGADFLSRKMFNNTYSLNYNLYIDPARTVIWGDGTQGTAALAGSSTCQLSNTCRHIIYGRIPAHQGSAAVGNYSDTIVVTLNY